MCRGPSGSAARCIYLFKHVLFLGYALIQREETEGSEKIKLIAASSRSLTKAENNYATIELEALAIQWAMKKCHHYLRGAPKFKVLTDHKPLGAHSPCVKE